MTRVCSYCKRLILSSGNPSYSPRDVWRVKAAIRDEDVTHGICSPCMVEQRALIAMKRAQRILNQTKERSTATEASL